MANDCAGFGLAARAGEGASAAGVVDTNGAIAALAPATGDGAMGDAAGAIAEVLAAGLWPGNSIFGAPGLPPIPAGTWASRPEEPNGDGAGALGWLFGNRLVPLFAS